MRGSRLRRSTRATRLAAALVVAGLAVLVLAPLGAWASPPASDRVTLVAQPASGSLNVTVTFAGMNIGNASTQSSAFHMSFGGSVNVLYTWSQPLIGGAPWSIYDARLQIFYFGFALGTRDISTQTGQTRGSLPMGNWSTGPLQYVLEGTFLLTASLIATNGTTAWSQSFWVDIAAPFYILALLPIILVVIAIYEVYALLTVGKHAALGKGATTPPASSPPSGGSAPATEGGDASPGSATGSTADAGPPPSGGGSS